MTLLSVPDMTCGHCVKAITSAVAEIDPHAVLQVDLAAHQVRVDGAVVSEAELVEALREAGYTPEVVRDAPASGAA